MERKKKFPIAWLSKQQKEILELLCSDEHNVGLRKELSRKIAEKFEKKPEISERGEHEVLSSTHRASMSRSIKRLEKRELIEITHKNPTWVGLTDKGLEYCKIFDVKRKLDEIESSFDKRLDEIEKLLKKKIGLQTCRR